MKNYFNEKERTNHIILMCMEYVAKDFSENEALSIEEKKCLKKISEYCNKLNNSIFDRFGLPYRRKIEGTLQSNTLRLVGKYSSYTECIGYCASEDLAPKVKDTMLMHCIGCNNCDYKNCAMYAMAITCGVEGKDTNGCPYKTKIEDDEDLI